MLRTSPVFFSLVCGFHKWKEHLAVVKTGWRQQGEGKIHLTEYLHKNITALWTKF
jgi:hypothetical protein